MQPLAILTRTILLIAILCVPSGPARAFQESARTIGWMQVDLVRSPAGDSLLAELIDDALYHEINTDSDPNNDVDLVLVSPGQFQADACADLGSCQPTGLLNTAYPLTSGMLSVILSTGDQVVTGTMTGAQLADALNQGAALASGPLPLGGPLLPSGLRYHFYRYVDALPGPQPWAWGAFSVEIKNRATGAWEPLDADRTYHIAANESLTLPGSDAPAIRYLSGTAAPGSLLILASRGISDLYPKDSPYQGPGGDGLPDGRILRDGSNSGGSIIPLTLLHHNDSHGRLVPTTSFNPRSGVTSYFPGYTQLAALIAQERAHNPTRTLLLSAGDNIQGDAMEFFFRYAGLGYTAEGASITDPNLRINPFVKAFNAMQYGAMTLGNHEFSFGPQVFSTLSQAAFPLLQANISDDGRYGLAAAHIQPFTERTVGGIRVAVLGIGNSGVASSELPERTTGLTFSNPIAKAVELAPTLRSRNDVVIALTHIGFTTEAGSADTKVDTTLARTVPGIDVVIGGHSHTDPLIGLAPYLYLPAMEPGQGGRPILVTQARSHNAYLGQVVLGLLPAEGGGYTVVSEAGRAIPVVYGPDPAVNTPEDPVIKALLDPYAAMLGNYLITPAGSTSSPLDAARAYTAETGAADLQADAAKWALEQQSVAVDLALLGAGSNRLVAPGAAPANPYPLNVQDLFSAVPTDSALVVLQMNGPQIKRVLERAYRNYWYYKHAPDFGGYPHSTLCMLVPDFSGHIQYLETPPSGSNVLALTIRSAPVNFSDATTTYRVATVEDLVTGGCTSVDDSQAIWPLQNIQPAPVLYSRDALAAYLRSRPGPVNPQVEGRLGFTWPIWIPLVAH